MKMITDWFRQQAGNPQVVFLTLFLLVLFVIVVLMGNMLAPLLAAAVIAYLLEGLVVLLQRSRVPRVGCRGLLCVIVPGSPRGCSDSSHAFSGYRDHAGGNPGGTVIIPFPDACK